MAARTVDLEWWWIMVRYFCTDILPSFVCVRAVLFWKLNILVRICCFLVFTFAASVLSSPWSRWFVWVLSLILFAALRSSRPESRGFVWIPFLHLFTALKSPCPRSRGFVWLSCFILIAALKSKSWSSTFCVAFMHDSFSRSQIILPWKSMFGVALFFFIPQSAEGRCFVWLSYLILFAVLKLKFWRSTVFFTFSSWFFSPLYSQTILKVEGLLSFRF